MFHISLLLPAKVKWVKPPFEVPDVRPHSILVYKHILLTIRTNILLLVCCFQATERLRRPMCTYKQWLNYLPTLSHFQWGPPRFLSNVRGKAMKLTHLHRGSRSRMLGALPPYFLCALTAWCSRTHTALCINKPFICNKVKYQGRHTVNRLTTVLNLM